MKTVAVFFALMLLGLNPLVAQDDARNVKFRVLCYEHSKDVVKALVEGAASTSGAGAATRASATGGAGQEVVFYTGGFSPQMTGRFVGGKARFFVETPGPDGKPVRKIVAEGDLVKSDSQMFILFPESKEGGPTYKILAFDDLEASFPMGATRVINIAPYPIRLNLAGADMPAIKAGGMQVYPLVKQVDEWNMYTARIDFGIEEEKWVPVATQSWKASDRKRDWVITHFDPESKSPAVRIFQDIPPWRETQLPVSGGNR